MSVKWGFGKHEVHFDMDTFTLKVGAQLVVSVSVSSDGKALITNYGNEWANWLDFRGDPELKALIEAANAKLQKASSTTKGKGKGPLQ